jgi:nickel transport system ATP-binding protein
MDLHPLLSVAGLTLVHNVNGIKRLLVKNLNFRISQGSIVGLIGASGCGKSLTCLAVMGLLPKGIDCSDGTIRFRKEEIQSSKSVRLRSLRGTKLAMILQNPMSCFDPVFTIRHHFTETLVSHEHTAKKSISRIKAALWDVGFEDPDRILSLYPFQMSGGMLQRVMVALASMMEVELLIADEPTTDLDVVSQMRVLNLLSKMRNRHGMSILLVTHDLSVVAHMADRVMVMQKGEIVEQGKVEDIFNRPDHAYTRSLLEAHLSLYDQRLNQLFDRHGREPQKEEEELSQCSY